MIGTKRKMARGMVIKPNQTKKMKERSGIMQKKKKKKKAKKNCICHESIQPNQITSPYPPLPDLPIINWKFLMNPTLKKLHRQASPLVTRNRWEEMRKKRKEKKTLTPDKDTMNPFASLVWLGIATETTHSRTYRSSA